MRKLLLLFSAMMLAFVVNAQVVFDFDANYQTYFPQLPGVSSGSNDTYVADGEFNADAVVTVDGVSITIKASAADAQTRNRVWSGSPRLRLYNEGFTVSAPGHKITSIEFNAHSSNFNASTESEGWNATTRQWVGSQETVAFTVAKNTQIKTITVTLDKEVEATPEVHIANTAETAYTVAKANDLITAGEALNEEVYVAGIISQIQEVSTSYGNATYFISDDGTGQGQLEIYRGYGLNGEKFTAEDDIKLGDKVIVKGKLTNYNGTYEFTTGSQIYSLNGKTGNDDKPVYEIIGDGSELNPYMPTDVMALCGTEACPTDKVWVIGYIMGSAKSGTALNAEGEQVATNIALGLSEDTWVPVQLPTGDVRDALNVVDHPSNIGQVAMVYGNIDKYFSVAGVKNVTAYYVDGEDDYDYTPADATGLTATYHATVLLPEVAEVPGMGEWAAPGKVAEKNIQIVGDAAGNVTVTGLTDEPLGAQYVYIEDEGEKYYYLVFAAQSAVDPESLAHGYVDGDFISLSYGIQTESATYYDALFVREDAKLENVTTFTATVEQMDAMGVLDIKPITTTCYVQDCGDYLTVYNLGGYSLLYGEKDAQGNIVLDASQEWPYVLDFTSEDGSIVLTANADGSYTYEAQMAYFGPNTCISITLIPGTANAIQSLTADQMAQGYYYNLNGQRVNAAQKGIVIKNGKKMLVK